jgi:Mg2+-importing ATPase
MKKELKRPSAAVTKRREETKKRLLDMSSSDELTVLETLKTAMHGLCDDLVEDARDEYGRNVVAKGRRDSVLKRLFGAFVNPFTTILVVLAFVSVFTDIVLVAPADRNYATVIIIAAMVMLSGNLRFVQETRSGNAAAKLSKMICTTASVERVETGRTEIPLEDIVVGDIIYLSAGDMVPADVRILAAKDLFVSQAALTGESEPVEKQGTVCQAGGSLTDLPNLAFMGSNVISGSAKAVAVAVGDDTMLGNMAGALSEKPVKTSFEKGVNAISWVLIRFMLVMAPIVFVVNGLTKHDWLSALLFAISIAVGLTPEMLPMIVTTNLAKGAVAMSKKKVIIRNLDGIQNLGSMDVLCTDKTGTLTQDKVVLEYYLNIHGVEDARVLRHAFLNSYFQTGLKNLIDLAIIAHQDSLGSDSIRTAYTKVDEIPFDFNRRRMSVVVADKSGKRQLITKGAVEEMLKCCAYAEFDGDVVPLSEDITNFIFQKSAELNAKGMRVIAVAHKTNPSPVGQFSVADETDMVLIGFLAFLDPPKETAAAAIRALNEYGVRVKIITGDNEKVSQSICRQVGLEAGKMLLGSETDAMTDGELSEKAEDISLFAKMSPAQKARIVRLLRERGHSVGYMGDGINDAAAMKAADVGISVDSAVDIAKESASVILLEKDLTVLKAGVVEGRKTYANMIKYIKMTASSNFGNMFSVLAASAFLPFLPMKAIHLILLNFIYDLCCTAIPWDNVDAEFLRKPRKWDASSVSKFMLWIGPTSSVFDITTFLILYHIVCPLAVGGLPYAQLTDPAQQALFTAVFQAGWFIESMWSQALVIHMIRTPKIPFIESRASTPLLVMSFAGIAAVTVIPFTQLGVYLGFAKLPAVYFAFLAVTVVCYMLLATAMKKIYVRRYGELL